MKDFSVFLNMRRYKNWLIKLAPENAYLKIYSASFSWSIEYLISDLHPELLSGKLKVSSSSRT